MQAHNPNLNRIQAAVDFIESNLNLPLTFQDVARQVVFSPYHFHRIFKTLVGESVTDYIRMRQLSEAARELITTRRRILDIAMDYRFGSQAAFTRAFKRAYTVTPGEYRRNSTAHILLEKKVLTPESLIHRCEQVSLEPRIVQVSDFWATGLEYRGKNNDGEIPAMWTEFFTRIKDIPGRVNPCLTLGVCEVIVPFTESSIFSYLAAVMVEENSPIPQGMKQLHVHPQTYAVFTHTGSPDLLGYTYRYIHGSWLLQSGYELMEAHDFECYDQRYDPENKDSQLDIYIPVREPKPSYVREKQYTV